MFTGETESANGDSDRVVQEGDPITLEDFLTGKLAARDFGGSWSPSGKVISRDEMGAVLAYDPQTNETKTLLGLDHEELLQGFKFDLSADERYLLVARGYSKIFRHSFLAIYDIVDLQENSIIPITVDGTRVRQYRSNDTFAMLNLSLFAESIECCRMEPGGEFIYFRSSQQSVLQGITRCTGSTDNQRWRSKCL